jgi:hypothetical protein
MGFHSPDALPIMTMLSPILISACMTRPSGPAMRLISVASKACVKSSISRDAFSLINAV